MSGEDKELEPVIENVDGGSEKPEELEKLEKVEKTERDASFDKKAKKRKKKKKPKFVDDGRTIYSMDGLSKHKTDKDSIDLSKKERRALIKAAFAHYLPIFLGVIGCFSIAVLIMYLWLH